MMKNQETITVKKTDKQVFKQLAVSKNIKQYELFSNMLNTYLKHTKVLTNNLFWENV